MQTIKVSITDAMMLLDVYMRREIKPAVFIRGPVGFSKSSRIIAKMIAWQNADEEFGGCYTNASAAHLMTYTGWPRPHGGVLSATSMPELFQPKPEMGLRGAFKFVDGQNPFPAGSAEAIQHDMLCGFVARKHGCVFVDEATKPPEENHFAVQAMLAYDASTGQWSLPKDGWLRVFVGNRVEDRSNDYPMPATFDNRVVCMEIEAGYDDAAPYWTDVGMHPAFLNFAGAYPDLVLRQEVPKQGGQFSTMRSWTEAWQDVMAFCQSIGIPHYDRAPEDWPCYRADDEMLAGLLSPAQNDETFKRWANLITSIISFRVGPEIAGQFVDFLAHTHEAPTYDDIVDDPANARVPNHPGVLHYTLEMIVHHVNMQDMEELTTYMARWPKALRQIWCTRMISKHPIACLKQMTFSKFMRANGDGARVALEAA